MVKQYMRVIFVVLAAGFWTACEKRVDFELKSAAEVLTVDAAIEDGEDARVVLTRSLNYFSRISPEQLLNSFIRDAEVFLSDGNRELQLRKYEQAIAPGISFVFYSSDTIGAGPRIKGTIGGNYRLRIRWRGQEYTAQTTIPNSEKTMDSVWWVKAPGTPDTSTRVVVRGRFTDPPRFGDYVRYFTKVNQGPFLPGFNSVFDDQLVNGTTYTADIDRGIDRNTELDFENFGFFKRGDTVTVKLSSIDKVTFDFWRTVEFAYQSIGNPFSSPAQILGNVSNGALGYFGGYANQFKTVVIPR